MLLHEQAQQGATVLCVRGSVTADDAGRLARAVDDAVARGARGVVIDLGQAEQLDDAAVAALQRAAAAGAPVAVAGDPRVTRGVPMHADVGCALEAIGGGSAGRVAVVVEHSPHGPAQARNAVERWAHQVGAQRLCEDLKLIVSELVTNAVRHGRPPVRVEVVADDRTVTVTVVDGAPTRPVARPPTTEAENGRGLLLIDLLAADHGVRPEPPGKAVWAALNKP